MNNEKESSKRILNEDELKQISGGDEYWATRTEKVTCSVCGSTDFTSLGCRESGYEIEWRYQCNRCGNQESVAVTTPFFYSD